VEILNVEMELELVDSPGQLIKILVPIGKFGGNIINIFHIRDRIKNNYVPVILNFDIPDINKLNKIKEKLQEIGIKIIRLERDVGAYKGHVILIGHVFDSDINDTIDEVININIEKIQIRKISALIRDPKKPSSVKFLIQTETEDLMEKAYQKFEEISKHKNLLMIKEL
ncbi:MAG: hypothetical protein ACTSWR_00340, partial [Candidatus Helarchaeota archaeon]